MIKAPLIAVDHSVPMGWKMLKKAGFQLSPE